MSKPDKLKARFFTLPQDFQWKELITLLAQFDYRKCDAGKTSGSRVRFYKANSPPITLHKPHPGKIVKAYQMKFIKRFLEEEGFL